MTTKEQRRVARVQRERGTFAPAWRDLNRRQSLVRWLFVFWIVVRIVFLNPSPNALSLSLLVFCGTCFFAALIKKPLMGLLLVTVLGYPVAKMQWGHPITSANVAELVWEAGTWLSIAGAEIYLCLFRCPHCGRRYFSFHPLSKGYEQQCEHCGIHRGSLYLPQQGESQPPLESSATRHLKPKL